MKERKDNVLGINILRMQKAVSYKNEKGAMCGRKPYLWGKRNGKSNLPRPFRAR